MGSISLVFVHTGSSKPPECMIESVAIATSVSTCKIYALANLEHVTFLRAQIEKRVAFKKDRLEFVDINGIPPSEVSIQFAETAKIDREFRDGFWFATSNRFFLIADFMKHRQLENCLHLENDVVLFFDPVEKLEAFKQFARFAIPFDKSRAIPGIVWYKDAQFALSVSAYFARHSAKPDFDLLREFCDAYPDEAKPLPTMSVEYATHHQLTLKNYCQGIDLFGGIFDAAAIGQYLGGVHWMNDPEDTRLFINESSELDVSHHNFYWARDGQYRYPVLAFGDQEIRVLNLHAHSKDSLGVSPFNCIELSLPKEIITGERLQSFADLTISANEVTQFHGVNNILSKEILEIPTKETRKLFKKTSKQIPPDVYFIKKCQEAESIFVYTHLLAYFKKYVAPRLQKPFTLISHNSDDGISINDLDLLNHPQLKLWFAQNIQIAHEKLRGLPIGLTNRQWGADKIDQIFNQSKTWSKSNLLYANFREDTHSSRLEALEALKSVSGVTKDAKVDFPTFIRELASHKFCICPRGNGADTHRFWEAQYLDCIPIIIKDDWVSAYSGLPLLVLDSWHELPLTNLQAAYIKISCTQYDRSRMMLTTYEKMIKGINF